MKRIAIIFGTRPEAIKLAPVIAALRESGRVRCDVCVTGQHREMLDQAMRTFGLTADANLDLMRANQTLAESAARALAAVDVYLAETRPDLVLVQGDTTTAFTAALAAFYRRIPVGHVEAGLRTGDLDAPFPEEANRVMTTRIATLHFAPTAAARDVLLAEGVDADRVHLTGNPVVDALTSVVQRVRRDPPPIDGLPDDWRRRWRDDPLVLITLHRRESFGEGLDAACRAIAALADRHPDARFVYPVHLNPNVRDPVRRVLQADARDNVHLIEPLAYEPFVDLLDRSTVVLTDSGGVQEEAPSLGKPVVVARLASERPEGVAHGVVTLTGTDERAIVAAVSRYLDKPDLVRDIASRAANLYGDGHAGPRIAAICEAFLGCADTPSPAPAAQRT
ncbi:MAG: UDP-N-acetylglucosamine 2-epimerase (non-hydrolyzing) [Phycisphaera sp.]|nr:UDP-N-acetylglucosamine 2-epimerase (non-hydrolyzing) [Phycisphaera sp.]